MKFAPPPYWEVIQSRVQDAVELPAFKNITSGGDGAPRETKIIRQPNLLIN